MRVHFNSPEQDLHSDSEKDLMGVIIIIIIHLFTVGKVSSQYKLIKTNYLNINPIYKCCIGIVLPSNF